MNNKDHFKKKDIDFDRNFAFFVKNNSKKVAKAVNYFFNGVKNETASTKESTKIIAKYVATQKISKEEEKHLKTQVYDVFKILGIGIPFVLIPGASLLIPFLLKAAEKRGIDLIPSNFKEK